MACIGDRFSEPAIRQAIYDSPTHWAIAIVMPDLEDVWHGFERVTILIQSTVLSYKY